jgi:uncharacterized UBP type Zn finger protein
LDRITCEDASQCALINPGNTCYLNSLLNVLAKVPLVRTWLANHQEIAAEAGAHHPACLLCTLGRDVSRLTSEALRGGSFVPEVVQRRGAWCHGFNNLRQQDAHEAFCALMAACEDVDYRKLCDCGVDDELDVNAGTNSLRYSTPFWRAFGGLQLTTVTCTTCSCVTRKYDMLHSMSMVITRDRGGRVEDIIADCFRPTPLDSFTDRCEGCQTVGTRIKQDEPVRWPTVLVLHLKRWEVQREPVFALSKNSSPVSFETVLSLELVTICFTN